MNLQDALNSYNYSRSLYAKSLEKLDEAATDLQKAKERLLTTLLAEDTEAVTAANTENTPKSATTPKTAPANVAGDPTSIGQVCAAVLREAKKHSWTTIKELTNATGCSSKYIQVLAKKGFLCRSATGNYAISNKGQNVLDDIKAGKVIVQAVIGRRTAPASPASPTNGVRKTLPATKAADKPFDEKIIVSAAGDILQTTIGHIHAKILRAADKVRHKISLSALMHQTGCSDAYPCILVQKGQLKRVGSGFYAITSMGIRVLERIKSGEVKVRDEVGSMYVRRKREDKTTATPVAKHLARPVLDGPVNGANTAVSGTIVTVAEKPRTGRNAPRNVIGKMHANVLRMLSRNNRLTISALMKSTGCSDSYPHILAVKQKTVMQSGNTFCISPVGIRILTDIKAGRMTVRDNYNR